LITAREGILVRQSAQHEGEVIVMAIEGRSASIKVRYPEFDFSSTPVVWGPNAEAVIGFDSGSPVVTPIEIFLLKVMRMAKAEMDPATDGELLRDMDLFNKQEAQHFKTHAGSNKVIREWCPEVAPIEKAFEDDLNGFLESRSLRWLVGYCESFRSGRRLDKCRLGGRRQCPDGGNLRFGRRRGVALAPGRGV
jgi:Predicted metal-dependent hydrolase